MTALGEQEVPPAERFAAFAAAYDAVKGSHDAVVAAEQAAAEAAAAEEARRQAGSSGGSYRGGSSGGGSSGRGGGGGYNGGGGVGGGAPTVAAARPAGRWLATTRGTDPRDVHDGCGLRPLRLGHLLLLLLAPGWLGRHVARRRLLGVQGAHGRLLRVATPSLLPLWLTSPLAQRRTASDSRPRHHVGDGFCSRGRTRRRAPAPPARGHARTVTSSSQWVVARGVSMFRFICQDGPGRKPACPINAASPSGLPR